MHGKTKAKSRQARRRRQSKGTIMLNAADVSLLKEMLIESVACGDSALYDVIAGEIDFIWQMNACRNCGDDLKYLYAQLAAVELAQGAVRNRVDTSTSRGTSSGEDTFDQSSYRDSKSQRTQEGTRCSWARATSFQRFSRDSRADDYSRSESQSATDGYSWQQSYDRSRQRSDSVANATSTGRSATDGASSGYRRSDVTRTSDASSGTPSYQPNASLSTGQIIFQPLTLSVPVLFTIPLGAFGTLNVGGFTVTIPYADVTSTNGAGFVNPGPSGSPCNDQQDPPNCRPLPSLSRGFQDNFEVTITLPFLGSTTVTWSNGEDYTQSLICASSRTSGTSDSVSHSESQQTDTDRRRAESSGLDTGSQQRDAHMRAEGYRNTDSSTIAFARGTAVSNGESHNGNDRKAKAHDRSFGQGTADSVNHMEALGTSRTESQSTSASIAASQLFAALADLWRRIMNDIQIAEKIAAASIGAASGKMKACATPVACNPRANQVAVGRVLCAPMGGSRKRWP
jgi:hypothetical protein